MYKSGKQGGQSSLEMTQSSKNSVKTSILSRDVGTLRRLAATKRTFHQFQQGYELRNDVYVDGRSLFSMDFFVKVVSTPATFVFTMDALPDRFLSATDTVSSTKRVIVDAFGAVSPGYFC
ncbi:hypothetical protein TNCV_2078241 [Trichonephila clavipes]|nr:hypothetical protein TNCV_2078241 [Trichonephila clavipes]